MHLLLVLLATPVVLVQLFGHRGRHLFAISHQGFQGILRSIHSARRINPRANSESDVTTAGVSADTTDLHQRIKPKIDSLREPPQPVTNQYTVLINQRHNVRHSRHRY